ncbi:MAG: prolyl oligopeptidase family serine peptidase [Lentisphaerae bacterium]|nr:prolyl oligopeptidase family serine peptidase [Lentisphaerota bacterium]HQL86827.1 prolyl oligopeptidase family serine peptidase [Lentisphaeria bacterium]
MDVQKKVTLAPGAWRLTEQTGSGFPAETRRLDYQSPADGLDDWALLKMPAPGVSTWLVCIHGHGSRGNQLYIRPDLQKLWLPRYLERGYGILTPNLRGNAWMGPAAVTDMDALLHFLRTQCQAKKFLFESGSMGGTSNLIYAGLRPENVAGVSARGAVIDLTAYHAFCRSRAEVGLLQEIADSLEAHYGGTPAQQPAVYQAHSPINHADKMQNMPIFLAHGTADPIMPVSQTRTFAATLATNPRFVYVEIPGGGHDSPLSLGYLPAEGDPAAAVFQSLNWIDQE